MINNRKLVLDTFCEVYNELKQYADEEFVTLDTHSVVYNAIYLISREQFKLNTTKIRELIVTHNIIPFLSNPAEGSDTLRKQLKLYNLQDLVANHKVLLIGGGDMDDSYPCLQYDSFLPKILDYNENIAACNRSPEIFSKTKKPYKFLFLNGVDRPHRSQLLHYFQNIRLLDQSLWTCLDKNMGPIKTLDPHYEYIDYQNNAVDNATDTFVKHHYFNNTWGEIYLNAEPYIDTYFSLVTETVYSYPYSFRTEKIWKPIAMGHPWIAVANCGYYRDMHNLGFQTFGHVIDESFDLIENNQDRLQRIMKIVTDLCQQDLAIFLKECYNVCKYNQQHLAEMRIKVRSEFPERFKQFITKHINE